MYIHINRYIYAHMYCTYMHAACMYAVWMPGTHPGKRLQPGKLLGRLMARAKALVHRILAFDPGVCADLSLLMLFRLQNLM